MSNVSNAISSSPATGTSSAAPERDPARIRPVLILIGAFLAIALWGALAQRRAAHATTLPLPASPAAVYLGLILMEWGLAFYVWKAGLGGRLGALRDLIGGRWSNVRQVAADAAIGLLTWAAWTLAMRVYVLWSGPDPAASVQSLLPNRPHEIALWLVLSLSAGFSEELVFRGYLQRRFQALTGSVVLATLLQTALFAVSHGYQGVRRCLRIFVYSLLLTAIAVRRKSLRPGMLAHAWTDVASGILRI